MFILQSGVSGERHYKVEDFKVFATIYMMDG